MSFKLCNYLLTYAEQLLKHFSYYFHPGCPFGQPTKNCSLNVCSNSVCIDHPNAVCYPDVCGDCSPRYFYGNDEVTNACGKF